MPRTASVRRPMHIRASVFTLSGQGLADGVVEVSGSDDGWSATLYALDRPGKIAGAYFVTGLREIVVRLDDGRVRGSRAPDSWWRTSEYWSCVASAVLSASGLVRIMGRREDPSERRHNVLDSITGHQ